MTSTTSEALTVLSTPMEVEEGEQQPFVEESGDLDLAIGSTFSVEEDAGVIDIKQEPEDYPEPEIAVEEEFFAGEEITDDNLAQVYPEINVSILQRAVSPPSYNDLEEQSIEELRLHYKNIYNLKEVSVLLESCDKIWETLQLIKNIQGYSNEEENSSSASPKNLSENNEVLSGLVSTVTPRKRREYNNLPEYRYTYKNKRKIFQCLTCNEFFTSSITLKSHAQDVHGVFYNPKRIYKIRTDFMPHKVLPIGDQVIKKEISNLETQDLLSAEPVEPPPKTTNKLPDLLPIGKSSPISQSNEKMTKIIKNKIKCVLCKRICTDIQYHLRVFHKVGCVSSVIDQCENVPTEYYADRANEQNSEVNFEPTSNSVESNECSEIISTPLNPQPKLQPQFEQPSQVQQQSQPQVQPQLQMQQQRSNDIQAAVRSKRRRKNGTTSWTVKKRKIVPSFTASRLYDTGPFKCNVCLGIYKSYKSFSHHRKLHLIRGETPQNFNPAACKFKNSPLRPVKGSSQLEMSIDGKTFPKNETPKNQATITNYFSVKENGLETETVVQDSVSQDTDFSGTEDTDESKSCECGRIFRKSHTLFLHKVKCKGILEDQSLFNTDTDSGLGISIKIKKNKNDSYEVVPSNAVEESCKEIKSSKDSDISSNDSGMASTDSSHQKIDSEASKYCHSILRIQVEENDEEVDIEDENSNQSILNSGFNPSSAYHQFNNTSEPSPTYFKKDKGAENDNSSARPLTRRSNNVPSLTNLCKQVLSKQQNQKIESKNELFNNSSIMKHGTKCKCACGRTFKNFKYFNIHVKRVHPLLLKCNYCKTNFDRIEKYTEHKCEVTEGQLFIEPIIQTQCLVCNELVDLDEPFDKHMKTHSNDTTYQCFKCELRFQNAQLRKAHFSKEHGFTVCQTCGKLLHFEYSSKHDAYHEGLGYPCHLCKKAFTQKILLKKHVQNIHDPLVNEFVKCTVCSKSMRLKYLKKHMSLHAHTEICGKCNKCDHNNEQKKKIHHILLSHPKDSSAQKSDISHTSFTSDNNVEKTTKEISCVPIDKLTIPSDAKIG